MGFLSKILNREQAPAKQESVAVACPHMILVPRWDSIQDMGKEELATSFSCQSCDESFTPEEAKEARKRAAEALQTPAP